MNLKKKSNSRNEWISFIFYLRINKRLLILSFEFILKMNIALQKKVGFIDIIHTKNRSCLYYNKNGYVMPYTPSVVIDDELFLENIHGNQFFAEDIYIPLEKTKGEIDRSKIKTKMMYNYLFSNETFVPFNLNTYQNNMNHPTIIKAHKSTSGSIFTELVPYSKKEEKETMRCPYYLPVDFDYYFYYNGIEPPTLKDLENMLEINVITKHLHHITDIFPSFSSLDILETIEQSDATQQTYFLKATASIQYQNINPYFMETLEDDTILKVRIHLLNSDNGNSVHGLSSVTHIHNYILLGMDVKTWISVEKKEREYYPLLDVCFQ